METEEKLKELKELKNEFDKRKKEYKEFQVFFDNMMEKLMDITNNLGKRITYLECTMNVNPQIKKPDKKTEDLIFNN